MERRLRSNSTGTRTSSSDAAPKKPPPSGSEGSQGAPMTLEHFHQMMNRMGEIASSVLRMEERQDEILNRLAVCSATINKHSELLSGQQQSLATLESDVSDLKNAHTNLSSELKNASSKIVSLESRLEGKSSETTPDMIPEIMKRMEKSQNIIIVNLPESPKDEENAVAVVEHIRGSASKFMTNISRIPGERTDKPRWLKISFSNADIVQKILKGKKSLHGSSRFRDIIIRDDKTKNQVAELNALRAELRRRQNDGETNLTIKYDRGRPIITSTTKYQPKSSAKNQIP